MDNTTNRYICIHGHFYQPPRENPWLDEIEPQKGAYPFHDWNERIATECYGPNTTSPVMNIHSKIIDISNNYTKLSFNFGATLLSWMERNQPEMYQAIIAADQESQKKFSGHGSAIAQAYSHMIMPLANHHDKRTQVIWGLKDFAFRFGREPEGMWLPETAVDIKTLEHLAEQGISYTILAPYQARRVRRLNDGQWQDVTGGKVDPTKAYVCNLPSGKSINLFFYEGEISHGIAFGGFLDNGEDLAKRLMDRFQKDNPKPQLVHVATDGETFGHHHRLGDMALAYCFHALEANKANLTNYGEFLEKCPPGYEVEIYERTSWSCAHGVERWRSDCGCGSTGQQGWNQQWRQSLREALDWLRGQLIPLYEKEMGRFVADPWLVRDKYIDVVLQRSAQKEQEFVWENSVKELSRGEEIRAIKLLEMQRFAMLMYTSCGWFFEEVSRIETQQILQYAARAIQLAGEINGAHLETEFLRILKKAKSNLPKFKDGAYVYKKIIKPKMVYSLEENLRYATTPFKKGMVMVTALFYLIYEKWRRLRILIQKTVSRLLEMYLQYRLDKDIRAAVESEEMDLRKLEHSIAEANKKSVKLDINALSFVCSQKVLHLMYRLSLNPKDAEFMEVIEEFLRILSASRFKLDFLTSQSLYFSIWKKYFDAMSRDAEDGDPSAQRWLERFNALDQYLHVH